MSSFDVKGPTVLITATTVAFMLMSLATSKAYFHFLHFFFVFFYDFLGHLVFVLLWF